MTAKVKTWNFGACYGGVTDFTDKSAGVAYYVSMMLNRVQSMLRYEGLPDSLPQRNLVLMLQTNGWVCIPDPAKYFDGKMYAFTGALGGEPDPYCMPTICTVANPALNFSQTLEIGRDCVIVPHDSMYMGLLPLFRRYASLLVENDITIRIADINARTVNLISAGDDRTLKGAQQYLSDIESGKLGVVAENSFLDGIKSQPYANSGSAGMITQLVELQQYLKASWFNDLGLNANYNMKREAINSTEAQLNDDALLPLVDNILATQQAAFDAVNRKYGTNIRVSLSSAWEDRQEATEDPDSAEPEPTAQEDEEQEVNQSETD